MTLRFATAFPASTLTAAILLASSLASADVPKNALGALAVSPDGSTVAAAGDNRVLYLVEPDSLAVRERIWIGTNPLELYYSADGGTLAMVTTDDVALFLSTETWEEIARVEGVLAFAPALAADSLAFLSRPKKQDDGSHLTPLTLVSLADGSVLLEAQVPGSGAALASRPDASAFAVLTKQQDDETEPKEDLPADLKGLDKEVFKQQHDGRTSEIVFLDAAGAETARAASWFGTTSAMNGAWGGEVVRFLGYQNRNPAFAADASTVGLWETPVSFNYGIAVSPDQTRIAVGTLRDGAVMSLEDGSSLPFALDSLEGWPEYFEGFVFAPDGSVYGGTSAYRLVHVGADGSLLAVEPVY